jgi:hypothetical protein
MANKNDLLKSLAGLLDTEPRDFDIHIAVVNPSREGSWIAGTELGGIRVLGDPADGVAEAVRNLFYRLTGKGGYRDDGDIQVALEMAVAGTNTVDMFKNRTPTLAEKTDNTEPDDNGSGN